MTFGALVTFPREVEQPIPFVPVQGPSSGLSTSPGWSGRGVSLFHLRLLAPDPRPLGATESHVGHRGLVGRLVATAVASVPAVG